MTDKTRTLTVYLDQDIRVDDVQQVLDAIRMIKYVSHVEAKVTEGPDIVAMIHAKIELRQRVMGSLIEIFKLDP